MAQMRTRLALAAWLALAGCSCGAARAPTEDGLGGESTPYTGFALPGLSLYRRCVSVPDHGTCSVYGVDGQSQTIPGPELFHRLGARPALELALRAHDLLLGESGQEPLRPGDDHASQRFVSEEEWSVIAEPVVEGGTLVFSTMEGEMHPQAMQLRIDLASLRIERTPVIDVWARSTPMAAEPSCEPLTECGCDVGCLRVAAVLLPGGRGTRYRALDPAHAQHFYVRAAEGGLLALADEECTEACPRHAPTYRCVAEGEACVRAALP